MNKLTNSLDNAGKIKTDSRLTTPNTPMKKKKMSPDKVMKRKKKMVSNAAGKVMGGLYSK